MRLTNSMHDAVKNSPVGQMIDRLIREEVARGGDTSTTFDGNVIQALWAAFMSGRNMTANEAANEATVFDSFRDIKDEINGAPV